MASYAPPAARLMSYSLLTAAPKGKSVTAPTPTVTVTEVMLESEEKLIVLFGLSKA